MTSPLNYCRQMSIALVAMAPVADYKRYPQLVDDIPFFTRLAATSQKFTLPEGGMIFEDSELKALNDLDDLNLPFETIALEYAVPGHAYSTKRIIFVCQTSEGVSIHPADYVDAHSGWQIQPPLGLNHGAFLDRSEGTGLVIRTTAGVDGRTYGHCAWVVAAFLNALACSNVAIERGAAPKSGAKLKNALPFDAYHTLVLRNPKGGCGYAGAGDHRSPREHLRRGHIRRYATGLKIWVNAHVVGAGTANKIVKDYRVR